MRLGRAGLRALAVTLVVLSPMAATSESRQEAPSSKPKLTLKGVPSVGLPSTVFVFQARLSGGRDDDEGLYCLAAEWVWEEQADSSLNEAECEPFKAGTTTIDRTFSEEQSFSRLGTHVIRLVLHKGEREIASAATSVTVRKP